MAHIGLTLVRRSPRRIARRFSNPPSTPPYRTTDSPKEPRISKWVAGRSQRVPLLVLGLSSLLPLP